MRSVPIAGLRDMCAAEDGSLFETLDETSRRALSVARSEAIGRKAARHLAGVHPSRDPARGGGPSHARVAPDSAVRVRGTGGVGDAMPAVRTLGEGARDLLDGRVQARDRRRERSPRAHGARVRRRRPPTPRAVDPSLARLGIHGRGILREALPERQGHPEARRRSPRPFVLPRTIGLLRSLSVSQTGRISIPTDSPLLLDGGCEWRRRLCVESCLRFWVR